jgi:hypothetical protein
MEAHTIGMELRKPVFLLVDAMRGRPESVLDRSSRRGPRGRTSACSIRF